MSYLMIALVIAVVVVLVSGVVLMGVGGDANRKYGNKLMVARVALQGMVLLLLAAVFALGKH